MENENWKIVYVSNFAPKAELLKSVLEENGIETILLNQQDSSYQTFGEIKLLVRNEMVIKAKSLLEKDNEE
tara:strand:+ start:73593 stop:73805 length:213 start_codon:yes stop_codon:yes gene_type:complete